MSLADDDVAVLTSARERVVRFEGDVRAPISSTLLKRAPATKLELARPFFAPEAAIAMMVDHHLEPARVHTEPVTEEIEMLERRLLVFPHQREALGARQAAVADLAASVVRHLGIAVLGELQLVVQVHVIVA